MQDSRKKSGVDVQPKCNYLSKILCVSIFIYIIHIKPRLQAQTVRSRTGLWSNQKNTVLWYVHHSCEAAGPQRYN